MKIAFTGGGTGGHFYPLIAVAEAIHKVVAEQRLLDPKLVYYAPGPFDEEALFQNNIQFVRTRAGKMRRYASLRNITDPFVTLWGTFTSFFMLLKEPPDVLFSKGGFASVPLVYAAHLLGIPIVIHESDSKPGRANLFGARYAYRIAVTFESSIAHFPEKVRSKIARTGIPVRTQLAHPLQEGAAEELHLDPSVPTVLVLGGSSGSVRINETLVAALPAIVDKVNIIHQTGKATFAEVESLARVVLESSAHKARYHAFSYLTQESLRRAAGAATLVVSRAGATSLTEIALWNKPSLIVPIPESISHDQRTNAYAYAHTGAAVVLEEGNMSPHIFASEIARIISDGGLRERMRAASQGFANPNAARMIADELLRIAVSHTPKP